MDDIAEGEGEEQEEQGDVDDHFVITAGRNDEGDAGRDASFIRDGDSVACV